MNSVVEFMIFRACHVNLGQPYINKLSVPDSGHFLSPWWRLIRFISNRFDESHEPSVVLTSSRLGSGFTGWVPVWEETNDYSFHLETSVYLQYVIDSSDDMSRWMDLKTNTDLACKIFSPIEIVSSRSTRRDSLLVVRVSTRHWRSRRFQVDVHRWNQSTEPSGSLGETLDYAHTGRMWPFKLAKTKKKVTETKTGNPVARSRLMLASSSAGPAFFNRIRIRKISSDFDAPFTPLSIRLYPSIDPERNRTFE